MNLTATGDATYRAVRWRPRLTGTRQYIFGKE